MKNKHKSPSPQTKNDLPKKIKKIINGIYFAPFLLILITTPLYVHHLSPGVYGTDSGDFISAALTKGIPHPSGYPLFTLLGILFLKLPIPATPAWKMGLISVLASSTSVIIFYLINIKVTKNKIISFISSLMLAFTYTFWLYAEVVEVFALHNLFILSIIYISIIFYESKNIKHLYVLSFLLGLSLTNNLSIFLVFPAIVVFILINKDVLKLVFNLKVIIKCFFLFILGLIPYIYIPIAANNNPYINWGMAVNIENFLYLVLRKKYGWGVGNYSKLSPLDSLHSYLIYFQTYLSPLVLVFSLIGLVYLFKKCKKVSIFLITLFIFLGPFYVIYSRVSTQNFTMIGVLERFYLSSIVTLMIFIAPGLDGILKFINRLLKNPELKILIHNLALITITIIPITFFIVNFQKTNLSQNYYFDQLAFEIVTPLPQKSYLLLTTDTHLFPTVYIRNAYKIRQDIKIPAENTNYLEFLINSNLFDKESAESFLLENKNSLIDYKEEIQKAIANLINKGEKVYSNRKMTFTDNNVGEIVPVPYGLVFHLVKEKDKPDKETFYRNYLPSFSHTNLELLLEDRLFDENAVLADLKILYAQYYQDLGNYIINHYQDYETGLNYIGKSFEYSIFSGF